MRFKLLSTIFLCSISLTIPYFANDEIIQIYVSHNSINLNQQLVETNALYEDDQDYFIQVGRVVEGNRVEDCSGCDKFSKYNGECLDKDCERRKQDKREQGKDRARRPGRRD